MFTYTPSILHPLLSIVLVVGFAFFGADQPKNRFIALVWVGGGLSFMVFVVTLRAIVIETNNRRADAASRFAEAIGKLDDEARAMVAFEFPTLRYHMKRGEVRQMFEDTNVPIEKFRLFLQTSNSRYISPLRDWCTAEKPEWMHNEIRLWLEGREMVIRDSAAGSHSWLWSGNSYQHLMAYWMAGRELADLNDKRVYAYEDN